MGFVLNISFRNTHHAERSTKLIGFVFSNVFSEIVAASSRRDGEGLCPEIGFVFYFLPCVFNE
jgi:hypothetical protein